MGNVGESSVTLQLSNNCAYVKANNHRIASKNAELYYGNTCTAGNTSPERSSHADCVFRTACSHHCRTMHLSVLSEIPRASRLKISPYKKEAPARCDILCSYFLFLKSICHLIYFLYIMPVFFIVLT